MIVQEYIGNDLVKTYSDMGMMIQGGKPIGLYSEAIDPIGANRKYVETNIPINPQEEEETPQESETEGNE